VRQRGSMYNKSDKKSIHKIAEMLVCLMNAEAIRK